MSKEKIDDLDRVIHLFGVIEPRIQTHILNHNIKLYPYAILLKCFGGYDLEEWNDGVLMWQITQWQLKTPEFPHHFIVRYLPCFYTETENVEPEATEFCSC